MHARILGRVGNSRDPKALKPLLDKPETAGEAAQVANNNNLTGMAYKILLRLFDERTTRRDTEDELFVYRQRAKVAGMWRPQTVAYLPQSAEAELARQATIETG